jgi:hypothetical protein
MSDASWGYSRVSTATELAERYEQLMRAVHSIGMFSGFCYTQFADTYQEANGLVFANREPKMPWARIARATRGSARVPDPITPAEEHVRILAEET